MLTSTDEDTVLKNLSKFKVVIHLNQDDIELFELKEDITFTQLMDILAKKVNEKKIIFFREI